MKASKEFFTLALQILFLMCFSTADAQRNISYDLSKWGNAPVPQYYSKQWRLANSSKSSWAVSLKNGRPMACLRPAAGSKPSALLHSALPSQQRTFKTKRGWFVAYDSGEWGGNLWWRPTTGSNRYVIAPGNIKQFLIAPMGLLALDGLEHMGLSKGRIIRLSKDSLGRWQARTFVNLDQVPLVATLETQGSVFVVTTNQLLKISRDRKTSILLRNAFWKSLFPNSLIIAPDRTVYIGMRLGVAKLSLKNNGYVVTWLLPPVRYAQRNTHLDVSGNN